MRNQLLTQAAAAIRNANRIVVACHVNPDADALGSLLGVGYACAALGKPVTLVSPDGVPSVYRFLPGWEQVVSTAGGEYDLGIGVDADGSDRLGSAETVVTSAPTVIDIDHHVGPDPYGQIQVVDSTSPATGELIVGLWDALGLPLSREAAVCLMAAILTDTGSFRYGNLTPETMRIAARLMEAGAHPEPIYEAIYGIRPEPAARLLGIALRQLQLAAHGAIVWSAVSQEDMRSVGATEEHTDGIINELRSLDGSKVAIFLRESTDGCVRVSFRSRDETDVAAVAASFGGGGHRKASGCTLDGPLETAVARVLQAAEEALTVKH